MWGVEKWRFSILSSAAWYQPEEAGSAPSFSAVRGVPATSAPLLSNTAMETSSSRFSSYSSSMPSSRLWVARSAFLMMR